MARPGSEAFGLGQAIASLFAPPDPNIARQRMMENMQIANQGEALIGARDKNAMLSGGELGTRLAATASSPEQLAQMQVIEALTRAGIDPRHVSGATGDYQKQNAIGDSLRLINAPGAKMTNDLINQINARNLAISGKAEQVNAIQGQNQINPLLAGSPTVTTEQGLADIGQKIAAAAQNYAQANSANEMAALRRDMRGAGGVSARAGGAGLGGGLPPDHVFRGGKLWDLSDPENPHIVTGMPSKQDLASEQKAADAGDAAMFLDLAERDLEGATGSRLGAIGDRIAGSVGVATEGARQTGKLKILAGNLVSKVPRFEGPQSNIDVQFYKEMAGNLADDTLPVEVRKDAIKTMREINAHYAQGPRSKSYAETVGRPKATQFPVNSTSSQLNADGFKVRAVRDK